MTSNGFIDRLERELRTASQRRVRLELARVPRVPAGATAFAVTALICAAVALPLLAVHSRSSAVPGGTGPAGGSVVVGCSDAISGRLPSGWRRDPTTVTAGPIAWPELLKNVDPAAIRRSHFIHAIAVVAPGGEVTVSVPAGERGRLALDYTSVAPRSRFYLSQGVRSVTFKPCRGSRPTQFNGGLIVTRAQCAELNVPQNGFRSPVIYPIQLGRSCLSAPPPDNVLKGNGIGPVQFGERPKSVVHKLDALLGQRPIGQHFGRNTCGIDGQISWPGLQAYFRHRRFVGYGYGPRITDGGVSSLATARNLRVGETVREARRLYGSAFKVSAAQGGSWSVRAPHGVIDGYLSDVTNPKGKVLTIEAGHVGCPAMTP